jgi:hypothetical protein
VSAQSLVIPRRRRLRRPPTRLLYYLLYTVAAASIVFHLLTWLFDGHVEPLALLAAVGWSVHMTFAHSGAKTMWRRWLDDQPAPAVTRTDWFYLALYVTLASYLWLA